MLRKFKSSRFSYTLRILAAALLILYTKQTIQKICLGNHIHNISIIHHFFPWSKRCENPVAEIIVLVFKIYSNKTFFEIAPEKLQWYKRIVKSLKNRPNNLVLSTVEKLGNFKKYKFNQLIKSLWFLFVILGHFYPLMFNQRVLEIGR